MKENNLSLKSFKGANKQCKRLGVKGESFCDLTQVLV